MKNDLVMWKWMATYTEGRNINAIFQHETHEYIHMTHIQPDKNGYPRQHSNEPDQITDKLSLFSG